MSSSINQSNIEAAVDYAKRGIPVLPLHWPLPDGTCSCQRAECSSVGKHPIISNGVKGATTDIETIKQWWTRNPRANVSLATGPKSGFIVLDVDIKSEGPESLALLEREHGPLPPTWKAKTGSGGYHYFFRYQEGLRNRVGILPGLDFKTDGGYIVAPPSVHASGGHYEWIKNDGEIAALPDWLLTLLTESKTETISSITEEGNILVGRRNDTLFSLACSLRSKGFMKPEIFATLQTVNNRCKPPLPLSELEAIARSASTYKMGELIASDRQKFNHTDVGNAQRLVAVHGLNFRYCHPWKKFLIWDSKRFSIDQTGEIDRLAKDTVRSMYAEAAALQDEAERKRQAKHALGSEHQNRLKAMTELAKTESGIVVVPDDLDSDDWLLNCLNGTVDLRTGELKPHVRENLITRLAHVEFYTEAQCPTWIAFLEKIMGGNADLIRFLQKAVGYSLTGCTREQCLFLLHGSGANGKSTFLNTIEQMLADYAQQTPTETLMVRKNDSIPNDIARLKGTRFVTAAESEQGKTMAETLIKQMTGGDKLTARFLHGEYFEFVPKFKLFLATNHKPNIRGTDNGIWRRLRLIPFNVTIPDDEQDRNLPAKLKAELPGILRWAVEGCLVWQQEGLAAPAEVNNATSDYRASMDWLQAFLDEKLTVGPNLKIRPGDLYDIYKEWCEENGEHVHSQRILKFRLEDKGFQSRRSGTTGTTEWHGIGRIGGTGFYTP